MNEIYAARVHPFLQEGEQIETAENVVCVATGRGVVRGPSGFIGDRLGRMGAVSGEPGSIARSIPYHDGGIMLGVTDRRVGLWSGPAMGEPAELWSAPRDVVARVERRPRRQMLARFRLHFADGSSTAFLTPRRATVDRLADLLGS